jgi:hypothetical protein
VSAKKKLTTKTTALRRRIIRFIAALWSSVSTHRRNTAGARMQPVQLDASMQTRPNGCICPDASLRTRPHGCIYADASNWTGCALARLSSTYEARNAG